MEICVFPVFFFWKKNNPSIEPLSVCHFGATISGCVPVSFIDRPECSRRSRHLGSSLLAFWILTTTTTTNRAPEVAARRQYESVRETEGGNVSILSFLFFKNLKMKFLSFYKMGILLIGTKISVFFSQMVAQIGIFCWLDEVSQFYICSNFIKSYSILTFSCTKTECGYEIWGNSEGFPLNLKIAQRWRGLQLVSFSLCSLTIALFLVEFLSRLFRASIARLFAFSRFSHFFPILFFLSFRKYHASFWDNKNGQKIKYIFAWLRIYGNIDWNIFLQKKTIPLIRFITSFDTGFYRHV